MTKSNLTLVDIISKERKRYKRNEWRRNFRTKLYEIKGQSRNGHSKEEKKSWKLKRKRDNENVIKETLKWYFHAGI